MLSPGTTLSNRYQIESVLGRGGMGAVYLARVPNLGNKPVAVKEMRLQVGEEAPSQSAVEQFKKEATFLANLEHPNLVQVTDFFEENSCHYLVMQYVEGSTLDALLRKAGNPVPSDVAFEWAEQLCSVLHYLHTRTPPILFRDLKPSNVMLDSQNRIRLIDFGIARVLDPVKGTSTFLQGVGSPGYAPLEQYEGQGSTDARSDIYSLGATLFHLLANQAPPSPIGLVSQQLSLPDLCEINSEVPAALNELVHDMMGLRQEQRPDSVAIVIERLKAIRAVGKAPTRGAVDIPTAGLEPLPTRSQGVPKALAAVAVLAILGLPFLGKALTSSGNELEPAASPVAASRSAKEQPSEKMPVEQMAPVEVKQRASSLPPTNPVKPRNPERGPAAKLPPPPPQKPRVVPDQSYPPPPPAVKPEVVPDADYPRAVEPEEKAPVASQPPQSPQGRPRLNRSQPRPKLRDIRENRRRDRTRGPTGKSVGK